MTFFSLLFPAAMAYSKTQRQKVGSIPSQSNACWVANTELSSKVILPHKNRSNSITACCEIVIANTGLSFQASLPLEKVDSIPSQSIAFWDSQHRTISSGIHPIINRTNSFPLHFCSSSYTLHEVLMKPYFNTRFAYREKSCCQTPPTRLVFVNRLYFCCCKYLYK